MVKIGHAEAGYESPALGGQAGSLLAQPLAVRTPCFPLFSAAGIDTLGLAFYFSQLPATE